nr:aminoacyl-tRNA synthetase, class 1a, anticodon-binding [Tanacetum cinerariifolium]
HNIDGMVKNGGSYDELRLFGIIQAETHISDPSHYGSINIFKRNFDDPLVFNNPGKYLEGLKEFLLSNKLPPNDLEESEVYRYIDDDAFEVCDDYAFVNFSDYFANKPNGGSGSCKLKGKDGYIELYYVALKYAVEATLEVDFAATSKETKVVGK